MPRRQSIFRVPKNTANPFVMIDHQLIRDPRLSWRAKGLMCHLLSRPDDWVFQITDLARHAPEGRYALRMALLELRTRGYVHLVEIRQGGRFLQYCYEVYEAPREPDPSLKHSSFSDFQETEDQGPESLDEEIQDRGIPVSENPQAENRALKNNELKNND